MGGVPGFRWCSWFFGCSGMFRDVPGCSGVPLFRVPVFLEVLHASKIYYSGLGCLKPDQANRGFDLSFVTFR